MSLGIINFITLLNIYSTQQKDIINSLTNKLTSLLDDLKNSHVQKLVNLYNIQFSIVQSKITNKNQNMRPQQILIKQVQSFLQDQHNIKISIPTLYNLLDSKVNLKIIPSSINPYTFQLNSVSNHTIDYANENRYKLIIYYIQSLLSSSSLDLAAIQAFMRVLNHTINTDIDIMQKNQVIRSNSFKMKEKLQFRIEEISRKTQVLTATSQKIHDKSDIINFIGIDIKNFLLSMKLIQNQYQGVRTVDIHTPLKIDKIYQYENSSQEDYHNHYQPLLEVLVRMKANMANLQQAVLNSQRIQVPIKSVNLLATCKNLLTQLQPFLITNQCSYNRLIFHVVTQQNQNMKLISSFYKHHLDFVKSLVYNVFKCVYLGHLFGDYYQQIRQAIQRERICITQMIIRINVKKRPEKQYQQIQKNLKSQEQNIQKIRQKIKNMKKIICFGKTSLLQIYLQQKICKKLNYLLQRQSQLDNLQNLLQNARKYIVQVKKLNIEATQISKIKQQVENHVQIIGKDLSLSEKVQLMSSSDRAGQRKRQKLFKDDFIKVQQENLRVSSIFHNLKIFQADLKEKKIKQQYFPSLYQVIKDMKTQLSQMQLKLLKSYQSLLQIDQEKELQAQKQCSKIIRQTNQYLTSENRLDGSTYTTMGGQILNQDDQCHQIKIFLEKIDRAQFLIKNNIKKKNSNSEEKFKKFEMYRKFLEWLLTMFESSMDQNILQNIVDKMDFKQEDEIKIQKGVGKVNQLLSQTQKHNRQVMKIIKQIQLRNVNESQKLKDKKNKKSKQDSQNEDNPKNKQLQKQNYIYNKIFIIARDRLILYEFIQMMYSEYLSVFLELKFKPNARTKSKKVQIYQFQSKGVKLFDQKIFQYALLYYHCLNKVSMVTKQLNDSNITSKTKNYLNDQIVDPYIGRLNAFLKFNQNQMFNLALKLQKSIQIQKNYKNQIKKWQEAAVKRQLKDEGLKQYISKIRQCSQQLQLMGVQIQKILALDKQRFVIHNMEEMKKIYKDCEQYIQIATQINKSENLKDIGQNIEFKNQKLAEVIKNIRKNCQDK